MPLAKKSSSPAAAGWALPLLVLALAVFVYSLYGFDQVLLRDYSIYLYSGQRMAEGIPPYVSIFDHKGPLSPMLAGLGVMLSQQLSWDDVLTVRLVFFVTGCLAVVAVYLLGKNVFRSQTAGFFGALTFLGFYAYAQPAASGPEPKTPMILFEILSLLLTVQKRWFWAGLCGSLALLVWQPMAVFPLATFVLAVRRPSGERYGAALRTLAGIVVPLAATVAYFYYHDALGDFLDGFVLFNVLYLVRGSTWFTWHVAGAVGVVASTYSTMLVPIVIGLFMIVRLYFLRPYEYRFAPILLSFPGPILFSLRDFQLADDFYVFLPYVAIGFGTFLALAIHRAKTPRLVAGLLGAILLAVALANTFDQFNVSAAKALKGTTISLSQQREGAEEIEARLGEDARLASINSPQVLVLLQRVNPNPYLWITAGVDQEIAAETPGGFEGWLGELESSDLDAISFFGEGQTLLPRTHLTSVHSRELDNWLNLRYHAEKIGPWWLFVKNPPTSGTDRRASIESRQEEGSPGFAG
jgi:hypothetical protein